MQLLDEFERLTRLMESGNLTFVRLGDGEALLMQGRPIETWQQADGWASPAALTTVGRELQSLVVEREWFFGIPCECCNDGLKRYLLPQLAHLPPGRVTFSNLFVNAAYPRFVHWIESLHREAVLITNHRGVGAAYPFPVLGHLALPDAPIDAWDSDGPRLIEEATGLARKYRDTMFLLSGGPLKVLFRYMYEANPNNLYIDVGSALDRWTHRRQTRPYQDRTSENRSPYSDRNCTF